MICILFCVFISLQKITVCKICTKIVELMSFFKWLMCCDMSFQENTIQCRFHVGPPSTTLAQHEISIGFVWRDMPITCTRVASNRPHPVFVCNVCVTGAAKPQGSICLLVKWADTAFWLCTVTRLTPTYHVRHRFSGVSSSHGKHSVTIIDTLKRSTARTSEGENPPPRPPQRYPAIDPRAWPPTYSRSIPRPRHPPWPYARGPLTALISDDARIR